MNWEPPSTPLEGIWGIIKLVIVVCSFFWFGWQVGLLMILASINLK